MVKHRLKRNGECELNGRGTLYDNTHKVMNSVEFVNFWCCLIMGFCALLCIIFKQKTHNTTIKIYGVEILQLVSGRSEPFELWMCEFQRRTFLSHTHLIPPPFPLQTESVSLFLKWNPIFMQTLYWFYAAIKVLFSADPIRSAPLTHTHQSTILFYAISRWYFKW